MTNAKPPEVEPEAEASILRSNSKVQPKYKKRYAEREKAMTRHPKGVARKALARSNADWLAVELAKRCLDDKAKLDLEAFNAILAANGIANTWVHLNPGQQRMCGGLKLRTVVANDETLFLPDEEPITPPANWVARYQR